MNQPDLPFAPACERNKQPILDVLREALPARGLVLEIGSATGQHIVYFASHLQQLTWQPSDQQEYLPGLTARIQYEGGENIRPPIELDVTQTWPDQMFDAVYSANTAHIMSWDAVCAMFAGIGRCLRQGGVFCLYGPFNENGEFTADSNRAFDQQLRSRDPAMGIRDVRQLETQAAQQHIHLRQRHKLPANNQLLVFRHD